MNKTIATTDNYYLSILKMEVLSYNLKNEIDSFLESECKHDHIFVKTIVSNELNLASEELYKIYELTDYLVNNPTDYDKADTLSDLVKNLKDDPESLLEMF